MNFQARLKGLDYYININERPRCWIVTLCQGEEREVHKISKDDFKQMDHAISFLFNDSSYMIDVVGEGTLYTVYTRGSFREIPLYSDESLLHESLKGDGTSGVADAIRAGMPGKITEILVEPGQVIEAGQPLLIMEAMKMENEIKSSYPCVVKEILVKEGDSVESGAILISFDTKSP